VYTDATGKYFIDNLLPGSYRIKFTGPFGYTLTAPGGGDSAKDSNPDRETGITPVFVIGNRALGDTIISTHPTADARFVNPTVDAGFVEAELPVTGSDAVGVGEFAVLAVLGGLALIVLARRRGSRPTASSR